MQTGNRPINIATETEDGYEVIPVFNAYVLANGLAIHRKFMGIRQDDSHAFSKNEWVITHVKSGLAFPGSFGRKKDATSIAKAMSNHSTISTFDDLDIPFASGIPGRPEINMNAYQVLQQAYAKAASEYWNALLNQSGEYSL